MAPLKGEAPAAVAVSEILLVDRVNVRGETSFAEPIAGPYYGRLYHIAERTRTSCKAPIP